MNDPIFESIRDFLDKNRKGPLLLGYSGGYDSKALLYLLYRYKEIYGLDLLVAHVDHKWRESSTKEAEELKEEVEGLKLPFYLKTLDGDLSKPNIEAYCRDLRLNFFKELVDKYSCEALILAHHRDDLSETVLKRVLEGADLPFLKGMEKCSDYNGMKIWRPLLDFSKTEIKSWLDKGNLKAIDDETNRDCKYLRSRIREKIIPSLSSQFGKEISKNLALISRRSIELKQYLDKKTQKYFDLLENGPFGVFLDFSNFIEEIETIELNHLIRRIGNRFLIDFSRDVVDRIVDSLTKGKTLDLKLKQAFLNIENGVLFILKDLNFFFLDGKRSLALGKNIFDRWEVNVSEESCLADYKANRFSTWKDLLKGQFEVILPKNNFFLERPSAELSYYNKRLSKWFSENKVPTFIRFSFPVIFKEDKMFYEFLSGQKRFKESKEYSYYRISFKLSNR